MNVSSAHDSVQSVVKSEDLTNKGSNKQGNLRDRLSVSSVDLQKLKTETEKSIGFADNSSQPSTDGEQEVSSRKCI